MLAGEATATGRPLVVPVSGDGSYDEVVAGVVEAGNDHTVRAVEAARNADDHRRVTRSPRRVRGGPRSRAAADRPALRVHHGRAIPLQVDGELLALEPGTSVRVGIAPVALATVT